jgi:hypothetical protein
MYTEGIKYIPCNNENSYTWNLKAIHVQKEWFSVLNNFTISIVLFDIENKINFRFYGLAEKYKNS